MAASAERNLYIITLSVITGDQSLMRRVNSLELHRKYLWISFNSSHTKNYLPGCGGSFPPLAMYSIKKSGIPEP